MAGNAIASLTDYAAVLKTIWPQDEVTDFFFTNMPFYAMVPKDPTWTGLNRVIAIRYGQTNGRSAKFANAKANKRATKQTSMTITTADNFSLFSVDHKTLTLTRNDKGALAQALTSESKAAMKKLKRAIGMACWGNSGGNVGTIASISTNTITLTDKRDARKIEVDDAINLSVDDGYSGSAGILAGTALLVSAVNWQTGVITFTTNVTAGYAAAAPGNFLFVDGDYASWVAGVPAYITTSDPGTNGVPTSIWGMNRTPHIQRLSGLRIPGTGLLIEEAIKKALTEASYAECETSHIFMSPDDFLSLDLALEGRRRYADTKVGNVGFTGITFVSHGGKPVEVYPDPDVKTGQVWGLDLDDFTFASAGEFPDFLTLPGQPNLRPEESTNSFEGRIGGYAQLYPENPGNHWLLTVS